MNSQQPTNIIDTINRVVRVAAQMERDHGREPSPEELASHLEISAREVRRLLEIARRPIRLNP